jgi:hypothetical protein
VNSALVRIVLLLVLLASAARGSQAQGRLRSLEEAADPAGPCERSNKGGALTVEVATTVQGEKCDADCKARLEEACKTRGGEKSILPSGAPYAETAPWQAQLLGGLGGFLAQRTKGEVIAWVEDLVGKELCSLTYHDLALEPGKRKSLLWFASTCAILQSPDYGMQMSTGMLAAAVRGDLLGLPRAMGYYAIEQYAEKHKKEAVPKGNQVSGGTPEAAATPEMDRIFRDLQAALKLIDALRRGAAPLELVAGLGRSPELRGQCKAHSTPAQVAPECGPVIGGLLVEFMGGVITPGNVANRTPANLDTVLSHALTSSRLCVAITEVFDESQHACDPKLVPEPIARYLRLFTLAQASYAKYRPRVERIARAMVILEAKVEAIKKTEPTPASLTDLGIAFQELIDAGFDLFEESADQAAQFDAVMALARELLGIVGDFQAGNYMAAGQQSIHLIAEIERELGVAVPGKLKRFLSFTMELAAARSSDDVTRAIEAVAAPIGGWKLKQAHTSVSITGIVGGLAGYEWPRTSELAMPPAQAPGGGAAAGLLAPVGIDFATPLGGGHNESMGLFLSVVDVGQLTWARLTNVVDRDDDIKAEPTPVTSFGRILSPGAYLHFSIGHSPLVIGGGVSYAPALRKYTVGAAAGAPEIDQLSTLRLGMFIAVDVTILPLWAGGS